MNWLRSLPSFVFVLGLLTLYVFASCYVIRKISETAKDLLYVLRYPLFIDLVEAEMMNISILPR